MALQIKINEILYEDLMNQINESYNRLKSKLKNPDDKWVLCLGAGVSVSCGLPDWRKLLYIMMGKIMRNIPSSVRTKYTQDISNSIYTAYNRLEDAPEMKNLFDKKLIEASETGRYMSFSSIDSLELAEYIKNDIADLLNCRIDKKSILDEKEIDKSIINYVKSAFNIDYSRIEKDTKGNETTLKAIADVMSNKKIHRAVTYNYDNLLEIALRDRGESVESYIPEDRKEFVESNKIYVNVKESVEGNKKPEEDDKGEYKIYHCHGRISVRLNDIDKKNDPKYKDEDGDRIILTESSYYKEEVNNYSLSNVLQSYAIDYCNTIFIGFSGADYTFRRIVRGINLESNERSYIFFSIDDVVKDVISQSIEDQTDGEAVKEESENKIIEAISSDKPGKYEFEKFMINNIVQSKTRYWREKGFEVIWSTIGELPSMIKEL